MKKRLRIYFEQTGVQMQTLVRLILGGLVYTAAEILKEQLPDSSEEELDEAVIAYSDFFFAALEYCSQLPEQNTFYERVINLPEEKTDEYDHYRETITKQLERTTGDQTAFECFLGLFAKDQQFLDLQNEVDAHHDCLLLQGQKLIETILHEAVSRKVIRTNIDKAIREILFDDQEDYGTGYPSVDFMVDYCYSMVRTYRERVLAVANAAPKQKSIIQ